MQVLRDQIVEKDKLITVLYPKVGTTTWSPTYIHLFSSISSYWTLGSESGPFLPWWQPCLFHSQVSSSACSFHFWRFLEQPCWRPLRCLLRQEHWFTKISCCFCSHILNLAPSWLIGTASYRTYCQSVLSRCPILRSFWVLWPTCRDSQMCSF